MQQRIRGRRRASLFTGAGLAAVSLASLTIANVVPAEASNLPPGNTIIIGSGSQTAYSLLVAESTLFNQFQGCPEVATGSQTQSLSFNCADGSDGVGLPANEGENPLNDVALQEPPLGGTNGLKQLEQQVTVAPGTTPISYASTVRNPLPTDPTGLNFVNYALDGVSWFHFTEVNGVATPSAKITNLTIPELANIWNGTYTNWDQIPGVHVNAPIALYVTNSGSGLLSLWNAYLGENTQSYVLSQPDAATHVIEQNEDASIIANGDEANAIFFFSHGRFVQSCKHVCGGTSVPGPGTSTAKLGSINKEAPTSANILSGAFPTDVFLSNVYSDGSNSTIPATNQATLNFASEDGFLCKPQLDSSSADIIDPNTGRWVHNEINAAINTEGFIPMALGGEGTVANPASLSSPYSAYDSSGTNPQGYCRVTTTDGNA